MKRKILTTTMLTVGLFFATSAQAESWNIDTAHSSVSFSVKHMMVTNVRGDFKGITGKINYDGKDATKGSVEITIDVGTINTNDAKRDGHLKGADFFDVAKYPKATFKSKKITKVSGNKYKIVGDLTLHGKTQSVTLDAEISKPMNAWGKTIVGIHATTTINRQDFGVSWNKILDKGSVVVGNDVHLTFDLEITKGGKKAS